MSAFTVVVKEEIMVIVDGVVHGARPMWKADGHTWYVKGALPSPKYEQCSNLVLNHAQSMHINAIAVKRYSNKATQRASLIVDKKQSRMKGF
jgi:hypothetical protein